MPSFATGTVTGVLSERSGLQRVLVELPSDVAGPEAAGESGTSEQRACVLTTLVGPVAVGDRVVVNTTAVERDLGTGGWHFVHWNLERDRWHEAGGGHIMKLRYTSLQADTGSAEEHLDTLPSRLDGIPVVACSVHSQVACVAVALRESRPDLRIVYVMTDGGALPLALSDLVAGLVERSVLDGTVTAGHAFGGDREAVAVPSALAIARHELGADVVVLGMGPGVVGTSTALGSTAVDVAAALDAAAALGGVPILAVRVSGADVRERHRGVSHHSTTILDLVRSTVTVAANSLLPEWVLQRHDVRVAPVVDLPAELERRGLAVTTMGRGPEQDEPFFTAAGDAGALAATLAGSAAG